MKVIYNKFIPLRGFSCINLFGLVFARHGVKPDETMLNHEAIHTVQMRELAYLPFYVMYIAEFVYQLLRLRNRLAAYYAISFEREAYRYQSDLLYIQNRRHYGQWRKFQT